MYYARKPRDGRANPLSLPDPGKDRLRRHGRRVSGRGYEALSQGGVEGPAQIELCAEEGDEYHFLFFTKGRGSANRSYLYEETRAILNPGTLADFIENRFEKLPEAQANVAFVWMGLLTVRSWFHTHQ